MSDSELSSPGEISYDVEIEQVLRQVVHEALANNEEITINLARARAESQLGLEAGHLKNTNDWKQRSKEIISAAVESQPSPEKAPKVKPKPKTTTRTKRKSESVQTGSSRGKKAAKIDVEEEQEDEAKQTSDVASTSKEPIAISKDQSSTELSDPPSEAGGAAKSQPNGIHDDDESDLSSVIDDPPPKKKRQKITSSSNTKAKPKSNKSKSSSKETSSDEEEIKRLQGWLLKCGVRKLWHRELASCESAKDKVRHLKGLLAEVGMTGRYSAEKAKQIKEKRELAAELEAAQEFNEQWGHSGSEDNETAKGPSRPRRVAPKGLVDFGGSGDDTD